MSNRSPRLIKKLMKSWFKYCPIRQVHLCAMGEDMALVTAQELMGAGFAVPVNEGE